MTTKIVKKAAVAAVAMEKVTATVVAAATIDALFRVFCPGSALAREPGLCFLKDLFRKDALQQRIR
jgi:hypothetical protein